MEPICRYLDHAILKPEMSVSEATEAINLGIQYHTRTVCVRPCDIALAQELTKGTRTDVCVVLDFPHGSGTIACKAAEAAIYAKTGVQEVDMVANFGRIRSGEWKEVADGIQAVAEVLKPAGILLKVIVESCHLSLDEVRKVTEICIDCGADFIKTSTGFNGSGASEAVIETMLEASQGKIKVKPSGGIRDYAHARKFVDMGCHRLGVGYTSTPVICNPEAAPLEQATKENY